MLEICNHTRSALPQGIESRLDSTLGVVLESVLDFRLDYALDSTSKSTLDSTSLDSALGYFCRDSKKLCEKIHIELVFVSTAKMRKINKEFLSKDYATDVLSFPLIDFPLVDSALIDSTDLPMADFSLEKPQDLSLDFSDLSLLLGSIVINLPLARENSLKFAHSLDDEIIILFIHAVLHLLGFDHERDRGAHRQKEREIIQKLGLSKNLKSLISRASSPQ